MGQHYVNAEIVGGGMVDPLRPEALVYEPREDGSLILVALESLVPLALWTEDDPSVRFHDKCDKHRSDHSLTNHSAQACTSLADG